MANGEEFLKDLQTYPILAQEVSLGNAPAASGPSTSLNRTVENLMRDVLGWRPKTSDPRGFVAALTQSFTLEEVEGHVEWSYVPRGYAVQADLGALTGAQASIYQRAKAALAEMLPILDRLYPLQPEYDSENVAAIRTIVHDALVALVAEFGVEGGPLVQRVNVLFDQLLGENPDLRESEKPQGQLGALSLAFGLSRDAINTLEEERNYTDFLMLVDYANGLKSSWDDQKDYFGGARGEKEPYLGTQLVWLSRQLGVIAESVQETYFALDSVFVGPAERQTTRLDIVGFVRKAQEDESTLVTWWNSLPTSAKELLEDLVLKNTSPIYLAELLNWVEQVVGTSGPKLIQDAGKAGVVALQPVLSNLTKLMKATALIASAPSSNPARGFHTARSARCLDEISKGLDEATRLADAIKFGGFADNSVLALKKSTNRRVARLESRVGRVPSGTNLQAKVSRIEKNIGPVPDGSNLQSSIAAIERRIGKIHSGTDLQTAIRHLEQRLGDVPRGTTLYAAVAALEKKIGVIPEGDDLQTAVDRLHAMIGEVPAESSLHKEIEGLLARLTSLEQHGGTEQGSSPVAPAPRIDSVEPSEGSTDEPVLEVTGSGLQSVTSVWLIHGATRIQAPGEPIGAPQSDLLQVRFNLSSVAPNTTWALMVVNIDGKSDTKRDAYHHKPYDESSGSEHGTDESDRGR